MKRIINLKTSKTGALLVAALLSSSAGPLPAKKTAGLQLSANLTSWSDLSYRITNNGPEPATLGIWSCDKKANWSLDGSVAAIIVWPDFHGCDKQVCSAHEFQKGESLNGSLKLQFLDGAKASGIYRLHFKSCIRQYPGKQPKNVIEDLWSEPVSKSKKGGG